MAGNTTPAGPDDLELDGLVNLASRVGGAPAFVTMGDGPRPGMPGRHAAIAIWPLRGRDGTVRGTLTVGTDRLDTWERDVLGQIAGQAGALLERRERDRDVHRSLARIRRRYDELAARTSHAAEVALDLRGPLAAVQGHLLLARSALRAADLQRGTTAVRAADGAAENLAEMLDDILDLTTLAADPVIAEVDLRAIVAVVAGDVPGSGLAYTGPAYVTSDATLLRRLLQHLVEQTVGRAPVGTRAAVNAGAVDRGWWLEVGVRTSAGPVGLPEQRDPRGGVEMRDGPAATIAAALGGRVRQVGEATLRVTLPDPA